MSEIERSLFENLDLMPSVSSSVSAAARVEPLTTPNKPAVAGIHGFDARQLGQRVAPDEHDKNTRYHGEQRGQHHLCQIAIADRNAAAQADFDE